MVEDESATPTVIGDSYLLPTHPYLRSLANLYCRRMLLILRHPNLRSRHTTSREHLETLFPDQAEAGNPKPNQRV